MHNMDLFDDPTGHEDGDGKGGSPPPSASLRAKVEALVGELRDKKIQGLSSKAKADPEKIRAIEARYHPDTWVRQVTATIAAGNLKQASHVVKLVHTGARGTNILVTPETLPERDLVGTHSLGPSFTPDITVNSSANLPGRDLLRIEHHGRTLLELAQAEDPELIDVLSEDEAEGREMAKALAQYAQQARPLRADPRLRQVFWLVGDDPARDRDFHLLVPLYSSSMAAHLYRVVQEARWSEPAQAARNARKANKSHPQGVTEFPNLARLTIGGANKQNVSQGNAQRRGVNYLLDARPPEWRQQAIQPPLGARSFFSLPSHRRQTYGLVNALTTFLLKDPTPNRFTHRRIDGLVEALIDHFLISASAVKSIPGGWSADERCRLSSAQQAWLDPEAVQERGPEASGAVLPGWQDEVAADFGAWLNREVLRLCKRQKRDLALGDKQAREWTRRFGDQLSWLEG
ncbi:type I-F CRISPR-associated protein Csy1 [Halomonas cerina]|uniref:CRISPR-associated protein Csy1 n=1 Tax=Halomonas cerina TaxID=447424 RepID=A0A839V690_9GAMM|nr:type I-F CRISPR-associated protein Csy1 [Halomonas cerina]MBB3190932.1 CRISPR-associated protein Csy1 [Halomonas cerina]